MQIYEILTRARGNRQRKLHRDSCSSYFFLVLLTAQKTQIINLSLQQLEVVDIERGPAVLPGQETVLIINFVKGFCL